MTEDPRYGCRFSRGRVSLVVAVSLMVSLVQIVQDNVTKLARHKALEVIDFQ